MAWMEQRSKTSWRVRYWHTDGTLGSIGGFPTKTAAINYAEDLETEQRRGTWIDPAAGKISLTEWATDWIEAQDIGPNTDAQYRSLLTNHLLPRWGTTALTDITNIAVAAWAKKTLTTGYAPATVRGMTKLLSLLLADAADDRLIPANPIRTRRRGKHRHTRTPERQWATPEQALAIADNAAALIGDWAAVLITTAAYTGARWGELTGLQRTNTHLEDGHIVIDPDIGALHEINGNFSLGPPKTAESARTITLPEFLTPLLRRHLTSHDHPHVFISTDGEYLRRSNFARRAMRPAADGNLDRRRIPVRVDPVKPGLTFHELRHSHKTWLIADTVPEVAQAQRLGHTLDNKIQAVYSHVAAEVEQRLLRSLRDRWEKALANVPAGQPIPSWRTAA